MDREAWRAAMHGVTKSQTWLSDWTELTQGGASLLAQIVKNACNARDQDSIPGLGRSPGEGKGYPLQYSCLENSVDRGAWQATRVAESDTTEHAQSHSDRCEVISLWSFGFISLISNIEHLFMCLLAMCISCAHFLIRSGLGGRGCSIFDIELHELLMYFEYLPLIEHMICDFFFPIL